MDLRFLLSTALVSVVSFASAVAWGQPAQTTPTPPPADPPATDAAPIDAAPVSSLPVAAAPVPATPPSAPASPDPAKPVVKVFGRVQLSVGVDPLNQGDVPEFVAPPESVLKREWNSSFMVNGALGAAFTVPKPIAGFTIKGMFGVGVYIRRILSVSQAIIELENADRGLKITVGKMIVPTINTSFPGSFQYPGFYGNLAYSSTGAKISKALGPITAEVGAGRPDFPFIAQEITPLPQANPPLPFFEGRLVYRNPKLKGEVPGSALSGPVQAPFTLSVSGAVGKLRVGPGERAGVVVQQPTAVDPVTEDLNSYVASAELIIPVGGFVLLSEAYTGRGTNLYLGGFRQRPRIDPMTGRHKALGTTGGYAQLSYAPTKAWTLLVLGGMDRVHSGLGFGIAVDGAARIESNRFLAGSVSRTFGPGLKLGLQVHQFRTTYPDLGTGTMLGAIGDLVMSF
ncbi:MAG: hypothetical protein JWP01_780 [Myxococcales bacterium]|nr:hypothetical protein [Myxococcales bacterium]